MEYFIELNINNTDSNESAGERRRASRPGLRRAILYQRGCASFSRTEAHTHPRTPPPPHHIYLHYKLTDIVIRQA